MRGFLMIYSEVIKRTHQMKKSQKFLTVDNLSAKLKQAKSLIFADYSGLKVNQINKLRQEIKKAGGEFEVIKNTLIQLALKNSQLTIENSQLEGPTAGLWLYSDDLTPLKTLMAFIKKNELPKIKFGFWDKTVIDSEKIKELANLPSLEELRAKLVGFLKSPLFGLYNGLTWNLKKMVFILSNVKK
jgi:large subunit ribosomal protein L10